MKKKKKNSMIYFCFGAFVVLQSGIFWQIEEACCFVEIYELV